MARKFLGMTFGKEYIPMSVVPQEPNGTPMSFSTPFLRVGSGNLSLPKVDKYYTQNGIVMFGADNLYPQLLNQMIFTSPIHGSIINFISNAVMGGGYGFESANLSGSEKVELMVFEKVNNFKKMAMRLTRDFIIHRRVNVVVCRDKDGKLIKLKRVDPSTIRNYIECEKFVYSSDWSRGLFGIKEYKRYDAKNREYETLYVYQEESDGQDVYPIPTYNSILNWCNLDGDIAYLQKQNIKNGVFLNLAVRMKNQFKSQDEIDNFLNGFNNGRGPEFTNNIMVVTGNGIDDAPEIVQINSNNNDKLFENTMKDLKTNIAIAHGIDPTIAGVTTGGSLGNNQQIEMLYSIFEKNVVMPLRATMEEILNDLIDIAKIPNSIKINNYQIVEKTIVADANNKNNEAI